MYYFCNALLLTLYILCVCVCVYIYIYIYEIIIGIIGMGTVHLKMHQLKTSVQLRLFGMVVYLIVLLSLMRRLNCVYPIDFCVTCYLGLVFLTQFT